MKKIKSVYKGKLINLAIKKVRLPNGYLACLEIIKHAGAALIIPFLTEEKIILLRQFRPVINSYLYEFPAGTLKRGELPLSCARREILEETGYTAKKLTFLGKIYPVPGYSTEKIFIYKAQKLKKQLRCTEEDEIIESLVVTKARLRKLFKSGKIVDAKTICALSMCGLL